MSYFIQIQNSNMVKRKEYAINSLYSSLKSTKLVLLTSTQRSELSITSERFDAVLCIMISQYTSNKFFFSKSHLHDQTLWLLILFIGIFYFLSGVTFIYKITIFRKRQCRLCVTVPFSDKD